MAKKSEWAAFLLGRGGPTPLGQPAALSLTRARRNEPLHGVLRQAKSDCCLTHATQ